MGEAIARALVVAGVTLATVAGARADEEDPTAELNAERNRLIEKIVKNIDVEDSVQRLGALVARRDPIVAVTYKARQRAEVAEGKARAQRDAKAAQEKDLSAWRTDFHRSAESVLLSSKCVLPIDPKVEPPFLDGHERADWGQVVRAEQIRLAPQNAVDEGELVTVLEVQGAARRHCLRADRVGLGGVSLKATVGDLLLVCMSGWQPKGPSAWCGTMDDRSQAARITSPPLITAKDRWRPIHLSMVSLNDAIAKRTWKYPTAGFVLTQFEVGKDLGGGRWEMTTPWHGRWILVVPPSLKNADLMVPGHTIWTIAGQPRWGGETGLLTLVAADLEAHYITEAK